jgi:hypothetical protein
MTLFKHSEAQKNDVDQLEKPEAVLPVIEPGQNLEVPSGYVPGSAEEQAMNKALNLKLDMVLLPFLSLLYLFNGLDRGNVGNAQTQGW